MASDKAVELTGKLVKTSEEEGLAGNTNVTTVVYATPSAVVVAKPPPEVNDG